MSVYLLVLHDISTSTTTTTRGTRCKLLLPLTGSASTLYFTIFSGIGSEKAVFIGAAGVAGLAGIAGLVVTTRLVVGIGDVVEVVEVVEAVVTSGWLTS